MAEPALDFDVGGALKAGYTEHEIASYLGGQSGFDVEGARKAGYNSTEIIQHLAPPAPPPAAKEEVAPQPVSGTALGMAKAAGQTVLETVPKLEVGVGAMMKSAGQGEAVESRRDIDLMHRLDAGEEFGALMKSAPNDLARLALAQYRRASPEEKTTMRQDAINTVAAPPNALERGGANVLAAGQHGSEEAKKLIPLTPEEEGRTSVVVAKTAASLLTFLAAAGPAGVPGMVAYGGVESYGKTYEEAKKAGASDEDATVAAAISGVVQGGLNAVPAHKALAVADQIPKMFKGEFIKTLTEMAKSGGTLLGFTQVSQLADNYIAKQTFEPARDLKQGLGENMGATFGVGALLPVVPAVAARAVRSRMPAEVAKPVMEAKTTDEAIAAAQNTVAEGTPVDINEITRNAEYGTTPEQNQARLLKLFGGMNEGTVEQAGEGYHYRTEVDGQEQTVPLKVWDPTKPLAEGETTQATISPDLAAAQRKHYDSLGVKVVYFENDARIPFDGAVDPRQPDTIFLSNDPQRNAAQVGAHEITHLLESTKLPDGTNLGDLLHDQVRAGMTPEGRAYAEKLFGGTAPKREAFGPGVEGDSAHGDAVVRHIITELGADIGAEAPKFQTFAPRVVEAIEQRYGADAAKGVLQKLIAGFKNALDTMRNFFSRADEHPEYGQTSTVSQHWVTNLADIHDTLAKMYAERFGTHAEKENASLTTMRERTQRDRFLANFERPASEIAPPAAPEGFAAQRPTEEPAKAPAEAAVPPVTPETPEAPRPPGPMSDPAAYAEAATRAAMYRRWLGELDEQRRSAAPASPQAALLKQTEAAILGKVNGVEARLTGAQAERLAAVRAQIDALHNPTTPSADMVKVQQALEAEQQRMADAASIGSPAAPIRSETAGNGQKPVSDLSVPGRIQAVMSERGAISTPETEAVNTPVAERPQSAVAPPRVAAHPIAEPAPVSAFQAKVRAERERLWAEEMPGYKREGGTTRQGLASASAGNERMVTESARDKVMREEIGEDAVMDAIERGLTDDQIFAVARFYRPEEGKTPQESFRDAVDRYAALEHEQALREEAAGLFDPDYDALKVSNPELDGIERGYRLMEEANARERAASEAPFESGEADGNGRADSPEVPERSSGEEAGGQSGGRGAVSGEEQGGDALKFSPRADDNQPSLFGDQSQRGEEGLPLFGERGRAAPARPAEPPRAAEPRPLLEQAALPERPRAAASSSEMLTDAGEKIGGARKDRWAERGLRVSDLEGMSEGEAFQHTTKDQVWPKPDYAAMVEKGMTPEAAAMVKIIRDRLAAKPRIDSQEGRRHYIEMMGHVRDALNDVKTADDFRKARETIVYEKAGISRDRYSTDDKPKRDLMFSVYKSRSEPFGIDYADRRKAAKMVAEGFPEKAEPWTRRYQIRVNSGGEFYVSEKTSYRQKSEYFKDRTEAEAEAAAKGLYDKALESKSDDPPVPKRPHLDSVQRTGADVRAGKNVTGDDFVNDFGFRGVEFGNWVASDERQKSVNLAYDALHDMAGVIGISPKAISLDGQLGLAFGARGSGSAAAHYEPGRLVINLTKLSGAGSLAHEWGHAVDHYFGTLDTGANTRGAPKGASGWYDRTDQRERYLTNLRPEMAKAFDGLMDAMFKREKPRAEAVRDAELRIEDYEGGIARQKERMEKSVDPKFQKDSRVWIEQRQMMLDAAQRHLAKLRDDNEPYSGAKVRSSYYTEANKLSGKSGESGYWSRPTEMFARAFESYVFDKIKAEGNRSDYLVQGVEPERYASGYKGNPYPAAERPAINAAFDRLFETMDERPGANGPALFSPRITGENKTRVYTPEEQKAFENVGRTTEPFSLRTWISEAKDDLGRRILRGAVDRYIGIKESDPEGYMALRIANSTAAAVSAFKDLGTLKFDGHAYNIADRNGGVTNSLLRPLGDEAHDFIWWVAANRAERLKGEDRENLFGDTDIAALKKLNQGTVDYDYTLPNGQTTRSREAVYLDSLRKLDVFNRNAMDLAVDAGLLPRDKVDALWSNPFYVPFYRQAAEGDASFVGPNTNSSFVKKSAFKTLKGGSEKLNNDLWENAFGNWQHMIDASLRNRAVTHVLDVASAPGAEAARKLTTQEANHLSDKEMKAKTVWIMKDGEKVNYLIEDPMLFKAVTVLDPLSDPAGLMTAGRWFKKVLQVGVTANPMFAVRNLIRDTEQTLAVAPSSANVIKNIYTGFKMDDLSGALQNIARAVAARDLKALDITDEAASAIAGGGLMRLNAGTESGVSNVKIRDVLNTPEAVDGFWNYVKTVAHSYREAVGQSEDVNRLALYKHLRDQGVPHDAASFAARDLADFTLSGASPVVRAISQLVPFTNARMQGLYKVGRAAADSDKNVMGAVGAKVAIGMTKRVAYVLGAATVLSLALDQIYKDDEEYQKLTDYDRSTYFNFRFGKTWFHIPKGFEIAALSNVATDGIEAFFDKKMTKDRFFRDVWQNVDSNLNMSPIPQAVRPVYDVQTNTSGLGRHIEPMGMEKLQPDERYTARSTMAARGLSTTVNAGLRAIPGINVNGPSPIQIDYMANAYGGWLATTSLGLADKVVRSFTSEPARPAGDFWADVTQGMVTTEPKAASRYTEMLYQQGKSIESAYATYRDMISRGQAAEAQKFFAANKDELQKHGLVSGLMRLESNLNKQQRLIENNPTMSPEQKKLQIQALNAAKNRAAQRGLEAR